MSQHTPELEYAIAIAQAEGVPNTCDKYGESPSPLPLWRFDGQRKDNLTGKKKGLLTVLGCAAVPTNRRADATSKKQNRSGALWVVQCVCGRYTRRRTKSLKNNKHDACHRCNP